MKKQITFLSACALCLASVAVGAYGATLIQKVQAELRQDFTVKIDGSVKNFKNANGEPVYPLLYNGTTYLPVRAIGEIMGKTVYWYEDDKLIEFKDQASTVTDADIIIKDSNKINNADKQTTETNISLEEAKKIALNKAGLSESDVRFKEIETDNEHGTIIYEIEFVSGGIEYTAEINAADGSIVKWKIEND